MEDKVVEILSTICASIILAIAILWCIYLITYSIKTENLRQKYVKTLNEHDKSVIMDYKNTFWTLKRKHSKNEN